MRDLEIYLATGRQKASGHYIIYWLSSTTDYRTMGACLGLGNQPCVNLHKVCTDINDKLLQRYVSIWRGP